MDMTATDDELLRLCIQDLHAGCVAAESRIDELIEAVGSTPLRSALQAAAAGYAARQKRLEQCGLDLSGPENLWMKGILDDAARDTRSIVFGPLLDVALIGAMRKAIAAERVSIETAIALADRLGRATTRRLLDAGHRDIDAVDRQLHDLLAETTA